MKTNINQYILMQMILVQNQSNAHGKGTQSKGLAKKIARVKVMDALPKGAEKVHEMQPLWQICHMIKEFVLCEQFWGSINGTKFEQIVKSALPLALDKRINLVERRILMDECPRQNSKVAKKTMESINAIVMATPARSPDQNPIEKIFAQVSMILQNQAVEQNITKETFSEFSARLKDILKGNLTGK